MSSVTSGWVLGALGVFAIACGSATRSTSGSGGQFGGQAGAAAPGATGGPSGGGGATGDGADAGTGGNGGATGDGAHAGTGGNATEPCGPCVAPTPVCDPGTLHCIGCLNSAQCTTDAPVCDATNLACRFSVAGVWRGTLSTGATIELVVAETEVLSVNANVTVRFAQSSCASAVAKGTGASPIVGTTAKVSVSAPNAALGWVIQVDFMSSTSAVASWPDVMNGGLVCLSPSIVTFGTPAQAVVPAQSIALSRVGPVPADAGIPQDAGPSDGGQDAGTPVSVTACNQVTYQGTTATVNACPGNPKDVVVVANPNEAWELAVTCNGGCLGNVSYLGSRAVCGACECKCALQSSILVSCATLDCNARCPSLCGTSITGALVSATPTQTACPSSGCQ